MKTLLLSLLGFFSLQLSAQTDIDRLMRGGELLLGGLSIYKIARAEGKSSKTVESVCVKNKLAQKITFRVSRTDEEDNLIQKELVIQKDSRECLLQLPKGIYTYEIILATNEVYKKGEYKIDDDTVFTVKDI